MKMTRTILRRLEMKIHHAMTLDQIRKHAEPPAKPVAGKADPMMLSKPPHPG